MAAVNGVARSTSGVKFFGSQVGSRVVTPIVYTGSPIKLFYYDIKYCIMHLFDLPFILYPFTIYGSGHLDELYPSIENLYCMFLHLVLFICQALFLLSVPFWIIFPVWLVVGFVTVFMLLNSMFCFLLNGFKMYYDSDPEFTKEMPKHDNEQWVFMNGVAVGRYWLRSNVNRLAITFGRPVRGVHNPTGGILFDLIQCLIQRNLYYATDDVRDCYKIIKSILYDPSKAKIIFILHSQGAIEGGMILDWLLQEVPQDLLAKLEVYTFGAAANHFNNPHLHLHAQKVDTVAALSNSVSTPATALHITTTNHQLVNKASDKTIRHIEHYANTRDPVAGIGVLQYTRTNLPTACATAPCFMGRVFSRQGSGHQLNQHYLDNMFPLNSDMTRALDTSEFMDGEVEVGPERGDDDGKMGEIERDEESFCKDVRESPEQSFREANPEGKGEGEEGVEVKVKVWDVGSPTSMRTTASWPVLKVANLSRLWLYRNGGSPPDDL